MISTAVTKLYRIFIPKRTDRSHPISKFFRKLFESNKTKHNIGIHIIVFLIIGITLQFPIDIIEGYQGSAISDKNFPNLELTSDTILTTDSTFQDPVVGYISQFYSWSHPAIDIAGNANQEIHPMTNGRVVMIEKSRWGYGNNVVIAHGNNLYSRYAHMSVIKVELNQEVTQETCIGFVGSTGHSTAPHVHFEIYKDGKTINPLTYIPNNYTTFYTDMSIDPNEEIIITLKQEAAILSSQSKELTESTSSPTLQTSYLPATISAKIISKESTADYPNLYPKYSSPSAEAIPSSDH